VPQLVGRDGLGVSRAAGNLADDPSSAVPIQPSSVGGEEDGAIMPFPGGQIDRPGGARCERDGDDFAALASDRQGPVPALEAQCSRPALAGDVLSVSGRDRPGVLKRG